MQEQWSQFKDDVDDVVPITIRSVQIAGEDVDEEGDSAKKVEKGSAFFCLSIHLSTFKRSNVRTQILPN